MSRARLQALAALAEARRTRALAELESLLATDRALAERLLELGGTHRLDMAGGLDCAPLALIGRRMAWAEARMAEVRAARAALAPAIDAARRSAAESLGKHEAILKLATRAAHLEARDRAARAEREAPPRA
jgi:hypothetical protein